METIEESEVPSQVAIIAIRDDMLSRHHPYVDQDQV